MKKFQAYCIYCRKATESSLKEVKYTESGKMLYIGDCDVCCYETKRIVTKVL